MRLDKRQIAWSAAAEQRGDIIQLRVQIANPGRHALRIGLTIVEDAFDRPEQLAQILAAAPLDDTWQISIDPVSGATEALVGTQPTPLLKVSTAPDPPDTAVLWHPRYLRWRAGGGARAGVQLQHPERQAGHVRAGTVYG